jgi:hypothetical protein
MAKRKKPAAVAYDKSAKLSAKEASALEQAQFVVNDRSERAQNSNLYRWARLVIKRHEAGRSIANAEEWLGAIMAGGISEDYLE